MHFLIITELFSKAGDKNITPNPNFYEDKKNMLLVAYEDTGPCGFLYAYALECRTKTHIVLQLRCRFPIKTFGNNTGGWFPSMLLYGIIRKQPKMFLYSIDVFEKHQRKDAGAKLIEKLKELQKALQPGNIRFHKQKQCRSNEVL